MRRIVLSLALLGVVAGCDPTGNTGITSNSATVRVANLVADADGISVTAAGANVGSGVAFGAVSLGRLVRVDDQEFITTRNSDNFVIGADSVIMTMGRRYTFYVLGTSADHAVKLAQEDTIFATAGNFKVRFVHGAKAYALNGLDLYVSLASDSLVDISPTIPSLSYAAASPYIPTDTSLKRIRVTQVGITNATLLDTTLTAAIADSTNITLVVSDKQGGGGPMRLGIVVDKAP